MAILEVKDLGINFGGLRAVDQFNLEIKAHQLAGSTDYLDLQY
jgi:branched-chain amino acid transport system ATP-binding protein